MFGLLRDNPALVLWKNSYCDSDYGGCRRYMREGLGKKVEEKLLPDGVLLSPIKGLNSNGSERHNEDDLRVMTNSFDAALKNLSVIEDARHRELESFSRFVPDQFLRFLHKDSLADVELGDAVEKYMGVMFSDIRNFTHLSEEMSVLDNFRFMNSYLMRMGPIIRKHNGFVDKFIGDEIMALFENGADDITEAAVDLQQELKEYNIHRAKTGYIPLRIGIGLHVGVLMLGTVGSRDRLQTTVIGDTVNIAARLEGMTKFYRVPILLSDAIYKSLWNPDSFRLREIDSVKVKGKEKPLVLYELYDSDLEEIRDKKDETRAEFYLGRALYIAGEFAEAKENFLKCSQACPEDRVARLYVRRCEYLMANPPDQGWAGISRVKQ